MDSNIMVVKYNPKLEGLALIEPNVVYSTATGTDLHLHILMPWSDPKHPSVERNPLIVFLQGSAWTSPNVNYELPQLAEYARMGYVVATITHRSALDGHAAPAFLLDAKTAIRFLRKNAEKYHIDPERVAFWGTSSGGNTALLVALTGDDPAYKTEEYKEYSDRVNVVVDCFGPTDLTRLVNLDGQPMPADMLQLITKFLGGPPEDRTELLKQISPLYLVSKDLDSKAKIVPPILLIHGDADESVRYEQSEWMFQALTQHGFKAEMIRVEGAPHEGSFWSRELHLEIQKFLKRHF